VTSRLIDQFDQLIRRDPARRGLIGRYSDAPRDAGGTENDAPSLCPGHLAGAAVELVCSARRAAIVTGFYIPHSDPPAAETDGPPGALLLADLLNCLGVATTVVTDAACWSAVCAAGRHHPDVPLWQFEAADDAVERFFHGPGNGLTHLISVERVGPAYEQDPTPPSNTPPFDFAELVPPEDRGRCHNMRGEIIDAWTAPLHRLFDEAPRYAPDCVTVGIGDGGNEIGMGVIPWTELVVRLGPAAARTLCRVATRWNIVAGTSNWGAAALAAAVALLSGRIDLLVPYNEQQQRAVLETLVADGPAVDGITRLPQPTVDGLPFLTYIQPWLGIRRLLDLDP
jgi:hypothetical protein